MINKKSSLRAWFKANLGFVVFVVVLCISRSSVADWYVVPTGSMKPTIVEGDRIFVNKMAYQLELPFTDIPIVKIANPERGDIVIINSIAADTRLVKRVIGLPGDKIAMMNNQLVINGKVIRYLQSADPALAIEQLPTKAHALQWVGQNTSMDHFSTITVPEGQYLVLGDNRNNSADSRVYGFVPKAQIQGKALNVIVSLDADNYYLPRAERLLHQLI